MRVPSVVAVVSRHSFGQPHVAMLQFIVSAVAAAGDSDVDAADWSWHCTITSCHHNWTDVLLAAGAHRCHVPKQTASAMNA